MALTFPCLRCGGLYEQTKRRASHFCPACRETRRRERRNERDREAYAVRAEWERLRRQYLDAGMTPEHVARLDDYADDAVAEVIVAESTPAGAPDRMPRRANAPAGPDEGTSTSWADVAERLDQRARDVEKHPWFDHHPHWSYGLHDEDQDGLAA